MYTSSEVLIGIGILLFCSMIIDVILGIIIIFYLGRIKKVTIKLLKLYSLINSKNDIDAYMSVSAEEETN